MGDTGDIFLAGANFWAVSAILGHFGSFLGYFGSCRVIPEPFLVILGHFWPLWAIKGHF